MPPPVMPEDGHTTRVTSGIDHVSSVSGKDSSIFEPIWDDDDTKTFYESLPDLRFARGQTLLVSSSFFLKLFFVCSRVFVPAVLLGESEQKTNEQPTRTHESQSVRTKDLDI